jgi:hypothetical protein
MTRQQKLLTLVVVVFILALNAWSLMRYPPPFEDEAWNASRAWAFLETGRQYGALDAGVFDHLEGYWTRNPWLSTFIHSLGFRAIAQPELFPLRITSFLFGLALLGAGYAIACHLYDWRCGLLSILLVSVSWPFLYSSHLARTDIMAAAFGFTAVALYFNSKRHRFWPGLLAGLCIGAAFEIHPHGAIFAPAIGALYFYDLRWSMLRRRHFWGFVTGGVVGLLLYAAVHILPYPETYLAYNRLTVGQTHMPPVLTLDPAVLLQALTDMALQLGTLYNVAVPILIIAAVALARGRSAADKRLLVFVVALISSAILLIRNKLFYYAILYAPALEMMLAAFLLHFVQQPWRGRLRDYASHIVVWGCMLGLVVLNLNPLWTWRNGYQLYQSAQVRIAGNIQPEDSIISTQTYWFGLYDHTYYSWEELVYYQRYAPGSTLEDALRELQPTILIIDDHWRSYITDEPGNTIRTQQLRLSASEMQAILHRYAELLDEFEVDHYGLIQIYRLDWQEEKTRTSTTCKLNFGHSSKLVTDAANSSFDAKLPHSAFLGQSQSVDGHLSEICAIH